MDLSEVLAVPSLTVGPTAHAGTMALQRGDTAAARAAMELMPRCGDSSPGGGTREELQTLVLLREVAQAEGDSVRQGPLLEQLRRCAGVTFDAAEVRHHWQSLVRTHSGCT